MINWNKIATDRKTLSRVARASGYPDRIICINRLTALGAAEELLEIVRETHEIMAVRSLLELEAFAQLEAITQDETIPDYLRKYAAGGIRKKKKTESGHPEVQVKGGRASGRKPGGCREKEDANPWLTEPDRIDRIAEKNDVDALASIAVDSSESFLARRFAAIALIKMRSLDGLKKIQNDCLGIVRGRVLRTIDEIEKEQREVQENQEKIDPEMKSKNRQQSEEKHTETSKSLQKMSKNTIFSEPPVLPRPVTPTDVLIWKSSGPLEKERFIKNTIIDPLTQHEILQELRKNPDSFPDFRNKDFIIRKAESRNIYDGIVLKKLFY